ncbi:unnamed protein product [Menidia menidia]|uniref:(Atlantic silverside) hypothetical protein n=1 Tax=Menidia menidia TaxID=238744 RepID=A0A8S4AH90_9TELE|nr:unnamed protein product [Menidia menidia]
MHTQANLARIRKLMKTSPFSSITHRHDYPMITPASPIITRIGVPPLLGSKTQEQHDLNGSGSGISQRMLSARRMAYSEKPVMKRMEKTSSQSIPFTGTLGRGPKRSSSVTFLFGDVSKHHVKTDLEVNNKIVVNCFTPYRVSFGSQNQTLGVTCCDDSGPFSSFDVPSAATAGEMDWALLSSQGGEKPDWKSFTFLGKSDSMSDGLIGVSVPITASAISAVLNCLFGTESRSSDSINLGLFSKSGTASSDCKSSEGTSLSERKIPDKKTHSCPQCPQSSTPKPVLIKISLLAEFVEELKKTEEQASSYDPSYDVEMRPVISVLGGSCLMCMASYYEQTLQPQYKIKPSYQSHFTPSGAHLSLPR